MLFRSEFLALSAIKRVDNEAAERVEGIASSALGNVFRKVRSLFHRSGSYVCLFLRKAVAADDDVDEDDHRGQEGAWFGLFADFFLLSKGWLIAHRYLYIPPI